MTYNEFYVRCVGKVNKRLENKGYSYSEIAEMELKYFGVALRYILNDWIMSSINSCIVDMFTDNLSIHSLVLTRKYVENVYMHNIGLSVKRLSYKVLSSDIPDDVVSEIKSYMACNAKLKPVAKEVSKLMIKMYKNCKKAA